MKKVTTLIKFLAIAAWWPFTASSGFGAVLIVNTHLDQIGDADTCSLREAIIATNQNADFGGCVADQPYGFDQIEFDPAIEGEVIRLTLNGAGEDASLTGDLDITDSLQIIGASSGTEINGNAELSSAATTDRVFDIRLAQSTPFPAVVDFERLKISNGRPPTPLGVPEVCGGGIRVSANSSLGVFNSVVMDNSIVLSPVPARGAGICVDGTLSLLTSEVSDNFMSGSANLFGAGIGLDGARINTGASRIRFNSANGAITSGGGIAARNSGSVVVRNSEISSNDVFSLNDDVYGGGIYAENAVQVRVSNSTISDNSVRALSFVSAQQADGGGMYLNMDGGGTLELRNSTIFNNEARSPNGAEAFTAGINAFAGPVELANTIIGGNFSDNDLFDCSNGEQWTSFGYNLVQRNCGITASTDDQFGVSPQLGPLSVSGIVFPLTQQPATHAPVSGSPVIDAGNPAISTSFPDCFPRDQREFVRVGISGPIRCDIGAHEFMSPGLELIFNSGFEG